MVVLDRLLEKLFARGHRVVLFSQFTIMLDILQEYLDKSFYKTASLIAASCRSAAALSDSPEAVKEAM